MTFVQFARSSGERRRVTYTKQLALTLKLPLFEEKNSLQCTFLSDGGRWKQKYTIYTVYDLGFGVALTESKEESSVFQKNLSI